MPFRDVGSLCIYQFESLLHPDLVHGVSTRRGGVSPHPWQSLNVGSTVGDDPTRVAENRRRFLAELGRDPQSVAEVWQVHSAKVFLAEPFVPTNGIRRAAPGGAAAEQPRLGRPLEQADILVSDSPHVTLLMRFADCVPILLFDPQRGAVGMVHAGWLGTVRKAAAVAVRALRDHFGCRPGDILAGIGPSVGPREYPVGPEVVNQVREAFGASAERHLRRENGSVAFDLWSANHELLAEAGVASIEVAGISTAANLADWYSHRAEAGKTGRFGAMIALAG